MNKTKAEIEQMASFICREKGQYMFNKKEIGIITGLCKDKVAELCENIPAACDSRVKLYFIKDVLNYLGIQVKISQKMCLFFVRYWSGYLQNCVVVFVLPKGKEITIRR